MDGLDRRKYRNANELRDFSAGCHELRQLGSDDALAFEDGADKIGRAIGATVILDRPELSGEMLPGDERCVWPTSVRDFPVRDHLREPAGRVPGLLGGDAEREGFEVALLGPTVEFVGGERPEASGVSGAPG